MGIEERREREKNERRYQILKSAVRVYMKDGYHASTMVKIAEEAELSRATLYLYFKTKDEIFVNAIVGLSEYFYEVLANIYTRRHKIAGNLLGELWTGFQKFYRIDPAGFNLTLYFNQGEMIRNLPEDLRLLLDKTGADNFKMLSSIMEYGVSEGIFNKCNPKTLAEVTWSAFLGIVHFENSRNSMGSKEHLEVTWELAYLALKQGISSNAA